MATVKEIYGSFKTTLEKEAPLMTMNKKLIINVAPTGSFTTKEQNPKQPYTMKENVEAAIAAYKAGASVWHVHAREEDGLPVKTPETIKKTIDQVLDKCPDMITSLMAYTASDAQGVDRISPIVEYLLTAGPQYIQTAVLLITTMAFTEKSTFIVNQPLLTETVAYLEERNIKAEFQGHSYSGLKDVYDWIVQNKIASEPCLFNLMAGFHGFSHASPVSPDPWNYIYLMTLQQTLPPGSVTGVCAGGRNWLPFTTMAILLGFDMVRIGMEDSVYMYPFSDQKIDSCEQVVQKVANIARELGRDVATPAEARKIMGLKN